MSYQASTQSTDTFTALDVLADRSVTANNAMHARRAKCATRQEANATCMMSYRNGEAVAYNDAHAIMRAELHRLCNLFQNGALSVNDFGIVL